MYEVHQKYHYVIRFGQEEDQGLAGEIFWYR